MDSVFYVCYLIVTNPDSPQSPHKLGTTTIPLLEETDGTEETGGPDRNEKNGDDVIWVGEREQEGKHRY